MTLNNQASVRHLNLEGVDIYENYNQVPSENEYIYMQGEEQRFYTGCLG